MRLKELSFYMQGNVPMVRVVHDPYDGERETIDTKFLPLKGVSTTTVMDLAKAVVAEVKKNG